MEHAAKSPSDQQRGRPAAERTAAPGTAATFVENRPEALAQRELPNAPRVLARQAAARDTHNSPRSVAQRQQFSGMFGPVHRRGAGLEAEELLQDPGALESAERPIQRRVHKFSGKRWTPGEKKKEGTKSFPSADNSTKGDYFNDVTGTVTSTRKAASEQLGDLLVKSGELENLATKETWQEWNDLGKALKKEFAAESKKSLILEEWRKVSNDETKSNQLRDKAKEILKTHSDPEVPLGAISFGTDEVWSWKSKLSETRVEHDKISAFLKAFMGANGQLEYIRRQPWFRCGDYGIEIEVNYYPHRGFQAAAGGYHKDTGGNNIFVNIIFHNDDPIPATELFPDSAKRSTVRRDFQRRLLPLAHRNELAALRGSLRKKPPQPVRGGVVGRHGYASWVDDVVWHATPDFRNRPAASLDTLMEEYDRDSSYGNDSGWWPHVIRALAEFPHTAVALHLKSKKRILKDVKDDQWKDLWQELYADPGGGVLENDLGKVPDRTLRFNRFFNLKSEAIALDNNLPLDRQGKQIAGQQITEEVEGLATRRRSNSDAQQQEDVRAAQKIQDEKGETRSFIRTWVKIVRLSKAQ